VKFILENDVEGMDLTFIEEEYEFGKLIKVGRQERTMRGSLNSEMKLMG